MKHRMKNKFLLYILILTLSSCALIPQPGRAAKEKLLIEHLRGWNEFQLEGIVEANYNSFSFRKSILIRKNNDAFRLDVFDSGFMGLNPTPFISIYMDSTLVIRPPFSKEVLSAEKAGLKELNSTAFLFDLNDIIHHKQKIVSQQILEFPEYKIHFTDKMQIDKIMLKQKPVEILFSYIDKLNQISITNDNKQVANIQIDKIEYKNIEIPILK